MEVREQGSFKGWDNIWKDHSSADQLNKKYTTEEPKNYYEFWQHAYAKDLLNLIDGKGYTQFCELGSGTATTSMYLSKNGYTDITLVDLAANAFKIASYNFDHYNLQQPKFYLENVEATSLAKDSFDCIYNIGLLEHFEDPTKVLKESLRLLKPGGMIYMPIVPMIPVTKELFQILIFNPVRFLKVLVFLAKGKRRVAKDIIRTKHSFEFYKEICSSLGYHSIKCIPYNPFPMVNTEGSIGEKIQFWFNYKYYKIFKSKKKLTFKTNKRFNICLLLVASK